ncbi:hypothetical protein K2173_007795 [Erythroxylum novogranatense]|uniref:Leucine-rich repeat-containing N-terminal plant-type domain-containing protein n=1 Tax=Erythroxylum novogranatense TaxID=1862640 RepID=A0AAV8TD34_9ROSI|nr:hypothetical protein K2173_007795 [Erythroxylum novogranatense]
MASLESFCTLSLQYSLFLALTFLLVKTPTSVTPLCLEDERDALLLFNQSIFIKSNASGDPLAYPKTASWELQGQNTSDCCFWDGVECDEQTGHVVGLDLSSSCIYASINSTSTLFRLVYLQRLNLGDNDFNYSQIPSQLKVFSRLTYLNLSNSQFYGQVPSEISELSHLSSLDLGRLNPLDASYPVDKPLQLKISNLVRLFQNLTALEKLDLSYVNISSIVPDNWGNLSSLTFLNLEGCQLSGLVPFSISQLTKLVYLNLGGNKFSGTIPLWLDKLYNLTTLILYFNNLRGEIPPLENLTQLTSLDVYSNSLTGQVPLRLSNCTLLNHLAIANNYLQGTIPDSWSNLVNIVYIDLQGNNFTGTVRFDMFLNLKKLELLNMPGNNLSLVMANASVNDTFAKFYHLGLGDCNIQLQEFPDFLRYQDELTFLGLRRNRLLGMIPKWVGDVHSQKLQFLFLSGNSLTGLEQPSMFSLFKNLKVLDIDDNKLEGPAPIPPPSILRYNLSGNYLNGELSPLFCNLHSVLFLDVSYNNLSGTIPQCLGNFSDSLLALSLANNSLKGGIPETFSKGSSLRLIDLSHNRLEGRLPRSLTNCKMLEGLDLSENHFSDSFPSWLGVLPRLQILTLRENQFFGAIEVPENEFGFPKLQILDLSKNNFTGGLSSEFFQSLNNMKAFDSDQWAYMQSSQNILSKEMIIPSHFVYQIILANKGLYMKYSKIPNALVAIDLSSNEFQGEIPSSIGLLKMAKVLNFSNNKFSGGIPSNFGGLTNLESLDLSQNTIAGRIPPQLTQLTFLAYFNVSYNQLEGPLLQGRQFDTFETSSYIGNSGLCGRPLSKRCGDSETESATFEEEEKGSSFTSSVRGIIIMIGFASGFVVGIVIGNKFTAWKYHWFDKNCSRLRRRSQRPLLHNVIIN